MKAITRAARVLLGVLLAGGFGALPASLAAQQREVPRILITTFRSPEKGLGSDAAEQVRKKVQDEVDKKELLVIPKEAIEANLKASGFNPDSAPDPITSRLLAQTLRADQYMAGVATKTPQGYRIDARVVLTSNNNMVQPLPAGVNKDLDDAAKEVAKSFVAARKQFDHVIACEHALQNQQFQQAAAHGQQAVAAYANSTNGRVCLAQAYVALKTPPDSVIRLAARVVQLDSTNKPALNLLGQAYQDAGQWQQAVDTWNKLIALDPKNTQLETRVVADLARNNQAQLAVPMIKKAVAANPGDVGLLRLEWLVLYTAKDWKGAIAAGERLAGADTASVDSTFFTRLAAAYVADSQPQKAAEVTSRAVQKYPNNASLWALNAQAQRRAGQTQQAVESARRAIAIDSTQGGVWLALAQSQVDLGRSDSALVSLRKALANGADTATVGQFYLVLGNSAYKHADSTKTLEDYQHAMQVLSMADSVASSPTISFLLGVSSFYVGDKLARANGKEKSCDMANQAGDAFTTAQMAMMQGGQVQPQAAQQILDAIQKYDPVIRSQKKAYCKK